ncbi:MULTISPECIES: 3,4-dihydroxy-2-butanone-4-phosphate synthase [unclassified Curtobacterium]|uniref:3,4-dihydroxy-2-butanone-4-phosphate synthase n=1 Tax=unclassified Curtobacterium TaxID=257496 RepID=UPI000826723E|nr:MULTISPECIES: 3,4-dihydroxy-2-butanone-4-phosphate synthase [unclassified Curtobacterium]WIA95889.1 3,4-dihydroxy-2-butanone-4-phosphate synthase [Curtobacterium sp. MCBA15_004]WIA99190.1 3,4-dihydroxy-2-butanone-4-phosphate synthase [Curtobacterium sp. MCBA15_012]
MSAVDAAHVERVVPSTPVAGPVGSSVGGTVSGLSSVEDAVAAIAAGRPVIVADDEHRENEGDVVLAAELASPEWIAWTVAHSSGFICAPVSAAIADALDLPPMVARNEDVRGTAYTVTVDAAVGVTTGISAHDRARTLRVLADPASVRDDLHRPGHVVPLRARPGGVRERAGHTEAAIELVTAAGLRPAAAICEIVGEDGDMMRLPGLVALGAREGVPVITIAALVDWLDAADRAAAASAPQEGTTR